MCCCSMFAVRLVSIGASVYSSVLSPGSARFDDLRQQSVAFCGDVRAYNIPKGYWDLGLFTPPSELFPMERPFFVSRLRLIPQAARRSSFRERVMLVS